MLSYRTTLRIWREPEGGRASFGNRTVKKRSEDCATRRAHRRDGRRGREPASPASQSARPLRGPIRSAAASRCVRTRFKWMRIARQKVSSQRFESGGLVRGRRAPRGVRQVRRIGPEGGADPRRAQAAEAAGSIARRRPPFRLRGAAPPRTPAAERRAVSAQALRLLRSFAKLPTEISPRKWALFLVAFQTLLRYPRFQRFPPINVQGPSPWANFSES